MKNWFKWLEWIPLIASFFAVLFILRFEMPKQRVILEFIPLLLSFILLFFVFLLRSFILKLIAAKFYSPIRFGDAVESSFKPILAKYIPGKIWVVLGPAHLLSEKTGKTIISWSGILLYDQLLYIVSGLLTGAVGLFFFPIRLELHVFIIIISLVFGFAAAIGVLKINKLPLNWLPKWIRELLQQRHRSLFKPFLFCMLQWFVLSFAYLIFMYSLGYNPDALAVILLQPLANNLGLLAVIAPGGIGVREVVMSAYLTLATIPVSQAAVISIFARVWFFMCEVLVFLIGVILSRRER